MGAAGDGGRSRWNPALVRGKSSRVRGKSLGDGGGSKWRKQLDTLGDGGGSIIKWIRWSKLL